MGRAGVDQVRTEVLPALACRADSLGASLDVTSLVVVDCQRSYPARRRIAASEACVAAQGDASEIHIGAVACRSCGLAGMDSVPLGCRPSGAH